MCKLPKLKSFAFLKADRAGNALRNLVPRWKKGRRAGPEAGGAGENGNALPLCSAAWVTVCKQAAVSGGVSCYASEHTHKVKSILGHLKYCPLNTS